MARNPVVYSTVFLSGNLAGGESSSVTVPDGFVWVLRDIQGLIIGDTNNVTFATLSVDDVVLLQWSLAVNVGIPSEWNGHMVCLPGETLLVGASPAAGGWAFRLSGYQLTQP